jgi:hypothetical protein
MSIPSSLAKLVAGPGLPELGPGPRSGIIPAPALSRELDAFFKTASLPGESEALVRAIVLLWHDHLESAHVIAQAIENAHGAFVHGIMHRREPDYNNAAYWFRRTGEHVVFPELGRRTAALLDSQGQSFLREQLVPNGAWSPFAFVEACRRAASRPAAQPESRLLREIQGIESQVLLEAFCAK